MEIIKRIFSTKSMLIFGFIIGFTYFISCSTAPETKETQNINLSTIKDREHNLPENRRSIHVITCNTGDLSGHKRMKLPELITFLESLGEIDIMFLQEIRGEKEAAAIAQTLRMRHHRFLNDRNKKVGIAILSKFPLVDIDHLYFKESKFGYGALSANIIVNGVKILLVNVHLDRGDMLKVKDGNVQFDFIAGLRFLLNEIFMDTIRSKSAESLVQWIEQKNAENIIAGGDFNTIPISKAIRIVKTMLNDVLYNSLSSFSGTYHRTNSPVPIRIDFLFHTPSLKVIDADIIRKSAGDHYPVKARFSID